MKPSSYLDCERGLKHVGSDLDPAEFHGQVCGLLSRGDSVDRALTESGIAHSPSLRTLIADSLKDLTEPESRFTPLLPPDDAHLADRTEALAYWCESFLYGLALRPGLVIEKCSAELQELIRDFTQISHAGVGEDEQAMGEEEETAYAELVEYVRVGVQVIFLELTSGRPPQSATVH